MSGLGLVLSGGAARGAYEAGVLRYLYGELARELGFKPWPSVVSGTSVGALNGTYIAARLDDGVEELAAIYENLRIEDVYRLHGRSLVLSIARAVSTRGTFALLDPSPLYKLVERHFPRRALRKAVEQGDCRTFIVSATELSTGTNTLYVDTCEPRDLAPLPGAVTRFTTIETHHLLASAALPFLFPPIEIDDHWFVDGGLRQNTPLRPVIRAGARHAIVVGVARETPLHVPRAATEVVPSLPYMLGKTLNAALIDPVTRDVHYADQLNAVIAWGREKYGEAFVEGLATDLDLRDVKRMFLVPSEDLGALAADTFRNSPPLASPGVRQMLGVIADRGNQAESDLLSYVFFDKAYTGALVRLGFEDARNQRQALGDFLTAAFDR